jgi:hypothetical protein
LFDWGDHVFVPPSAAVYFRGSEVVTVDAMSTIALLIAIETLYPDQASTWPPAQDSWDVDSWKRIPTTLELIDWPAWHHHAPGQEPWY